MKKILIFIISIGLAASTAAQLIKITFNGVSKSKNYRLILDGTSYYSNSNISKNGTQAKKTIVLSDMELGSHKMEVYRLSNNKINGNPLYSNTFQLQQGFDMNITVNGNGQVTFSERRNRNTDYGNLPNKTPMADADFDQLLQNVNSRFSQSSKTNVVRNAFSNTNYYFTTSQVRELISLITSENTRLELAKVAYLKVTDAANFTQLYDVFNSTASKEEMNSYIRNNSNNGNNDNQNNIKNGMAENQFSQLLQNVNNQYDQSGKFSVERDAFNNTSNNFSTSQIRRLIYLLNSESDKLSLAKLSYARVTDKSSFTSVYDLFSSQASRDDLNNFINGTTTNTKTPVAEYQFNQLVQKVTNQGNQGGKFNTVRDAFNTTSNYFSTAQVKQLLLLINSENDRLALAKLSYARVSDIANFISLYDLLNSASDKNDLNSYVIQNGGTGSNTQYNTRTPMADAAFSQVLQKAGNHFLPWDKVRDVKDAFNNTFYYFTTAQIRQLLSLVSSESDRLELAKLAWARVTDPAYFTQLNDLFSNQSSRDDLNVYINAHPF